MIDVSLLEPAVANHNGDHPTSVVALIVAYSQAVSLKRIADYLGRMPNQAPVGGGDPLINIGGMDSWRTEATMPRSPGSPAPGAEEVDDFDTEAEATPAAAKVTTKPLLAALPPKAIGLGYQPLDGAAVVDPGSGSPVDRNAQVRVFFANGQQRTLFAGSVAWRAGEGDAWRPLGFLPAGDGANVASES